jgi:coenzyme PQQ precursor peptide PqqA
MPQFQIHRSELAHPPALTNAAKSHGKAPFSGPACRRDSALTGFRRRLRLGPTKTGAKEMAMKWKTPVIIEIAVGLEINAYASAEVK